MLYLFGIVLITSALAGALVGMLSRREYRAEHEKEMNACNERWAAAVDTKQEEIRFLKKQAARAERAHAVEVAAKSAEIAELKKRLERAESTMRRAKIYVRR